MYQSDTGRSYVVERTDSRERKVNLRDFITMEEGNAEGSKESG